MKLRFVIFACAVLIPSAVSCSRQEVLETKLHADSCEVGVIVSGSCNDIIDLSDTRTSIGSDAVSVRWEPSDRLYLWAELPGGGRSLDAQEFRIYGMSGSFAYFSSTISQPMAECRHTYYCCSPKPESESLGTVEFSIPVTQDGGGQGIMVSDPVEGGPLRSIDGYADTEAVSLRMHQMAHLLQLYLKDDNGLLGGEKLRRIILTFPQPVVGRYSACLADPFEALKASDASNVLTMEFADGMAESGSISRNYAYAAIAPVQWSASDAIGIKMYSDTKVAVGKTISLLGRDMQAGHATPVCIVPSQIKHYCHFDFHLDSNPVGEEINSVTLIAPEGCRWGDDGTNVFTYSPGGDIPVGSSFSIGFEEEDYFHSFGGKTITVNYDSEHVTLTTSFTLPALTGIYSDDIALNVPWLLREDFSSVPGFSSNDEYKTSKAGSYSPYTFLNGWSAARAGAEAGKCIRLACRRETSADYDARADSAPLNCKFKKVTDINVSFNYGSNNRYGGIPIITDGNVGQNCYVGYITTSSNYKSGSGDGTFDRDNNSFYTKEYTGSYSNTPNDIDFTISNIPAGASPVRITWHTEVEHQAGTTNTTAWLYIDNVVVTIAN